MFNVENKLYHRKEDEECHYFFVRYGQGEFEKEPIKIKIGTRVEFYAGFEMLRIAIMLFDYLITNDKDEKTIEIKGTLTSPRDLSLILNKLGIDYDVKKRYGKSGNRYMLRGSYDKGILKSLLKELKYNEFLLLNIKSKKRELKVKEQETPKPTKLIKNFVSLKLDKNDKTIILNEFLFDCDKKSLEEITKMKNVVININKRYVINKIIVDEDIINQDPEKARILAKRCGYIMRYVEIKANNKKIEYNTKINFCV